MAKPNDKVAEKVPPTVSPEEAAKILAAAAQSTTEQAPEDMPEMLRKISAKTVLGNRPPIPDVGIEVALYRVYGQSHGTKTGNGDNGPFCAFLGAFEAIRYSDRKRFQSGQCFVPKAVEDMLVATLRTAQKGDNSAMVEFAIEVGVKGVDRPIPFEYTVKNLVQTQNADPFASLRGRLKSAPLPALPAPKTDTGTAVAAS